MKYRKFTDSHIRSHVKLVTFMWSLQKMSMGTFKKGGKNWKSEIASTFLFIHQFTMDNYNRGLANNPLKLTNCNLRIVILLVSKPIAWGMSHAGQGYA